MFTKKSLVTLLGGLSVALAQTSSEQYPSLSEIEAAQATVLPHSPVSNVKGLAFDRFVNIWLENTDFDKAAADAHMSALAKKGLLLTNFWAVTHPSEPNYCAAAGGDTFGMDNDNFNQVPANVSTIADLFDTKNIAWGEYQEHLPYPGYQGFRYPESGPNDYVRKHNPAILFDSVTQDATRLRQIKNFTSFYDDLKNHRLPQHMFITPNMTNDAHDTNITFAATWSWNFLSELLENDYFTKDTLILLTFDENGTYKLGNKIYSILLGGAVPKHLIGKEDNTYYNHYSVIASLSANWGLPSLGRWDCGANLLSFIAEKTGYVNWEVDTSNLYLNHSYPGPLSTSSHTPNWPVPLTKGSCSAGHGILKAVRKTYKDMAPTYNYTSPVPYDAASKTNVGVKYTRKLKNGHVETHITQRRKKKCDENRPVCGGCTRNKLSCHWPAHVSSRPVENDRGAIPVQTDQHSRGSGQMDEENIIIPHGSPQSVRSSISHGASSHSPFSPAVSPTSPAQSVCLPTVSPTGAIGLEDLDAASLVPMGYSHPRSNSQASIRDVMPRSLSMLPGYSPESYQLLSHYLATTADCMANGSTPVNPFLVQIVPLAFTSDLLLQLVLTQSAAHRAFRCRNDSDEVAQSHYTKALQLFRKGVTDFIDGKESNPLMLTVGALLMCFTETARGDMNGTIFDHLSAANTLLIRLLAESDTAVPKDLKNFVIEYYTYTATVSMISIDARVSRQLFLNFDLEQRARQLLESEYIGNLCGCWLELLLMIPCIFDMGRQWMMEDGQPGLPTADDIAMFGSLQAQILRWTPYPSVTPEVFLAGRIFQQAMLLYLYTSLGAFSRAEQGIYQGLIDAAITDAMSYLHQLSATARINSGLCWPIAVVGSCLSDLDQQNSLRQRLHIMVNTFGLGNMQRTLLLLEHMWQVPLEQAGPWNICRAMQQHQIWISFA
ncbi:hypothetical protein KXX33_006545 [Aspergillus fumigatus]|nr:hypothetical protein KXX45_006321 [Aspergillus fumigatus]KAH1291578.1 hypothetical protein KXX48_007043 [Aspergillus fumigatus]KAH1316186.1 hypothetical protein KXX66_006317 [Aspergillus fumigatus]KAH1357882.1 hypothetical protein KXX33_006545 [Aspergillus fumigatus]KAH1478999.1 hypothetical protein KXX53_001592 [Aspergillus fumigatus]